MSQNQEDDDVFYTDLQIWPTLYYNVPLTDAV